MAMRLVAIGASLGGLRAVETLLAALPASFTPAVVVVQHRRATAGSQLPQILARHCRLPVVEPDDKQPVTGGAVYLAPADYHLLIEPDETFALSTDPPVAFSRPSADVLFESAARVYGRGLASVVLTGSSDDGAAGAVAAEKRGGIVIVQDPSEAESPVAPRATIARTLHPRVLPLAGIPPLLVELATVLKGSRPG
jgi:two-component system, chemotaxis family, protein-glutamate methylesterase/glutaminase